MKNADLLNIQHSEGNEIGDKRSNGNCRSIEKQQHIDHTEIAGEPFTNMFLWKIELWFWGEILFTSDVMEDGKFKNIHNIG